MITNAARRLIHKAERNSLPDVRPVRSKRSVKGEHKVLPFELKGDCPKPWMGKVFGSQLTKKKGKLQWNKN